LIFYELARSWAGLWENSTIKEDGSDILPALQMLRITPVMSRYGILMQVYVAFDHGSEWDGEWIVRFLLRLLSYIDFDVRT
jgi:hypothetical protein